MNKRFAVLLILLTGCAFHWVQERIPPPQKVGSKISFHLLSPSAQSVFIAGEFNGWEYGQGSPRSIEMKKGEDGIFRAEVEIPAGRYQYKFVLDNYTWILDPHNPLTVDDGRGNVNSLLIVQ